MKPNIKGYRKKHPILINIGILSITLVILFLSAEVIFRVNGAYATFTEKYGKPYSSLFHTDHTSWFYAYPPHRVTSQKLKEYSYSILANNEGFLDKDFIIAKKTNTFRIMVIGDSFVQGMGAVADSTLPKQLEGILRTQYGKDPEIEVWNCGIANSDPFFEYMLLSNRLLKYNPDYVIEVVNFTDITDVILRRGFNRFNVDSTVTYSSPPWFEPLYARSFVVRRIVHDILGYNWLFLKPKQEIAARNNSAIMIDSLLTDYEKLCNAHNIPLLVAFHPGNYEMPGEFDYSMQPLINYCDSTHIPAVDIKSCLDAQGIHGEKFKALYWPIDGHCNRFGYMYFARCISTPLMEYLDSVKMAKKQNDKPLYPLKRT